MNLLYEITPEDCDRHAPRLSLNLCEPDRDGDVYRFEGWLPEDLAPLEKLNLWNEQPTEGETDQPFMNREEAFLDQVKAFRIVKWLVREVNFSQRGQNDDLYVKSPMGVFNRRYAEIEFRKRLLEELKRELAELGSVAIIKRGSTHAEVHADFIN